MRKSIREVDIRKGVRVVNIKDKMKKTFFIMPKNALVGKVKGLKSLRARRKP